MKYVDEFRDGALARRIGERIAAEVQPGRRYHFMEFCGGHTHAISRYGIGELLPAGIRMIRIDRRSGQRVYGTWPGFEPKAAVIWEAFKADAEPRRIYRRVDELKALQPDLPKSRVRSDSDFLRQQGGIY